MRLTLAERRAVTEIRYSQADRRTKGVILDELCATTGWHRSHARKALASALQPKAVSPRRQRPPTYRPDVVAALTVRWKVLGFSGRQTADTHAGRTGAGAAPLRGARHQRRHRRAAGVYVGGHHRPPAGSRMAQTSTQRPVPHQAGIAAEKSDPGAHLGPMGRRRSRVRRDRSGFPRWRHPYRSARIHIDVTDIATGWTDNRSVPSKASTCVFCALKDVAAKKPLPRLGMDSDFVVAPR